MFADTLAHWPGDPRPAPKDPSPPKKTAPRKAAATKKTVAKKRRDRWWRRPRKQPSRNPRERTGRPRTTGYPYVGGSTDHACSTSGALQPASERETPGQARPANQGSRRSR